MEGIGRARVRYELGSREEGFVLARSPRAAAQALRRMLERHRALGNRIRRRVRADGQVEFHVMDRAQTPVARYWLDPGAGASSHMLMTNKS